MFSLIQFVITYCLLQQTLCFLFNSESKVEWDALKITWGPNPFSSIYFSNMPRTELDALKEGFIKISSCNDSSTWRGSRFIKSNDHALVLIYDVQGYIAGIQTGVPKKQAEGFTAKKMRPIFSADNDYYYLTVYFIKPNLICTKGRSEVEFKEQGTGTNLYFLMGSNHTRLISFPRNESSLNGSKWVEGKCFFSMGKHYWYDFHKNSSCTDYFPLFLMYNHGRLNAFGWALATDVTSPRLEHPPHFTFSFFMKEVPKCLHNVKRLSTMHIFLSSYILMNTC